jgi:hypothetical protein
MPIPASPLPDYRIQQPDLLANYAKVVQLKNMLGQSQQLPLDLQIKQQQAAQEQQVTQQQQIATQQAQAKLASQQAMAKAWADPDFAKTITTNAASSDAPGFDPNAMMSELMSGKYGKVLPEDAGAVVSGFLDRSSKVSETAKNNAAATSDKITAYQKTIDDLQSKMASILDMPVSKAQPAFDQLKQSLAADPPESIPPQELQAFLNSSLDHLPSMINLAKVESSIAGYHKDEADALKEQAGATQATRSAAAPTADQLKTATDTVNSYTALPDPMKAAFVNELKGAPDWETLQKVQSRADSAEQSEGMKQATLAQAKAMMGNKFGEVGLTANEKIWTDPQRGYAGALAQANQTKASIVAGADGNALLTNMIPTMEVLGINHAGGINRISPAEAQAAGVSPDWATRWNAWATKSLAGKLTPELAKEGNQLMDIVTDAAYNRAIISSQLIAKGHSIDPSQTPAMTKTGEITTLDKVTGKSGAPALIFARDTNGVIQSAPAGTELPKGWTLEKQEQKTQ